MRALGIAAAALGVVLYLGGLERTPLQPGNEAMYAYPPIAMLETGDYLVPRYESRNFLEKPPLVWWIIAASYRLFGISVFAERLPGALASLATVVLVGLWVRRRGGNRQGVLAAAILLFTFAFAVFSLQFAADAFLTLAVTVAVFTLDGACRRPGGSDLSWGLRSGAALAFAFGFKGLAGIAIPVGAVVAGLVLDRTAPVRALRRGGWTLLVLVSLLAPWHWAMTRRLGLEFWRSFYWQNQFLRGATDIHMRSTRGPFYYLEILSWAAFPWSLLLPFSLRRRRPSSVPLGWFLFALLFWSLIVMKREVYLLTLLPAAAILVAERFEQGAPGIRPLRIAWAAGAGVSLAALGIWAYAWDFYRDLSGTERTIGFGAGMATLAIVLGAGAWRPDRRLSLLASALACGVFLFCLQRFEEPMARFDPFPDWGERVRRECAAGCDGFFVRLNAYSLEFYSRFEWTPLGDPRELVGRTRHARGFIVMRSDREPQLAELPMRVEVLDRRPTFRRRWASAALERGAKAFEWLSLVRIDARARPQPASDPAARSSKGSGRSLAYRSKSEV